LKNIPIIDRYIASEVIRPFALGLLLLVIIYVSYSSAVVLTQAANGLMQSSAALRVIVLKTIVALEVLVPTALYLAVIAAISRLYHDSEMFALSAAGISQLRILGSVVKPALVIALIVGFLSVEGRPWAYRVIYQLEAQAMENIDIKNIEAGQFIELENSQYTLSAKDIDPDRGRLKEVFLQKDQDGQSTVVYAEEAYLPPAVEGTQRTAEFYNAQAYVVDNAGKQTITMNLKKLLIPLEIDKAGTGYKRKAESTGNLLLSEQPKDIAELQWRMSTPLATLLLALLAVPLSRSKPRQSRFYNFFFGILIYILLFSFTGTVRTWVEQERIGTLPGLWGAYTVPAGLLCILLFNRQLKKLISRS
jgi:lipopolysaccharide export system permease protein